MLDDVTRLDALSSYDILDTPPEPEFDDIVHIAQRVCNTSAALVSLVATDRQWFKARVGFDACETPIDQSVCAFALAASELMVIPDLAADPRTRDNTLVTGEPFIRFYAGAVLRTPEGTPIGSLCVLDGAPRPGGLTSDQAETLRALARQTMVILGFRRAVGDRDAALVSERRSGIAARGRAEISDALSARVHKDQARQTDAQEAGGIGTFDLDVSTYRCRVSAEFCRIFGLPVAKDYAVADMHALVVEADRRLLTTPAAVAEGSAARDIEFRVRRATDGAMRWVKRSADFRTNAAGEIITMVGAIQDVTDRKLSEVRNRALITLGDRLRDATTTAATGTIAGQILVETLSASRGGYGIVDETLDTYTVEGDWCAPEVESITGIWPNESFRQTIDQLREGSPFVVANVPAARWLSRDAAAYAGAGIAAQVNVPLVQKGTLVGVLFVHSNAPRTWNTAEIEFTVSVADRAYAAIAKIKAEEHQRVLNQELSHRLKNTLAMVQAITNQTLRGIAERDVVQALEARIIALSKAHDVLLQQSWASARLATVVENVLGSHGHEGQIQMTGPAVTLGPKATLSLSMLMHEMATNAIKYGALSVEEGRVAIDWRIESGAEPLLVMTWVESGGPPAVAPKRRGFGSRLIGMGLAGAGKSKLDYTPEGLRAEFVATMRVLEEV